MLDVRPNGWLARTVDNVSPLILLTAIGAVIVGLTLATPFAFERFGDNAFMALTIPAGLLTIVATAQAERTPTTRALWLILGVAIGLRAYVLLFDPLLSSDIYRYVWDGKVQATGINPYRYVPADPALASLRDGTIFPHINRATTAVTIYPPVAQFFFLIVTRIGENVTVMRLALVGCEAVTVAIIALFLRRMNQPVTRVVAYLWHPLPLWEIASSGHVDALMLALMLLGLWIALSGHALRGAALIAFSVLVKPLCGAGAGRDLAAVGSENAACRDRHRHALLSSLSVGRLGRARISDPGLSDGKKGSVPATISGRCRSGGWCLASITAMSSFYVAMAALVLLFAGLSVARSARSPHRLAVLPTSTGCYSSRYCYCRPTILGTFWSSRRSSRCAAPCRTGLFRSVLCC